jgi:ABC-type multidrug transport system fused ATPase/permease subunit
MRYWDISGGSITIDNTDIRTVDLISLRRQFGVVPQQPVIFEGSIADNIAYGATHATRDAIERAATMAEIHAPVARLAETYDTVVGTQGIKLSVGEKQRINIARAILRNPRILILDEATSSLDSESESLIQQAMKKILKGRTSIVIAHRLSTVTHADKIIVLDHGRIIQSGTHASLLEETGGMYHTLYEEMVRQSKESGI